MLLGALLAVLSAVVSTGALRGLDVAALDAARSVATSGLDLVASLVGIFGAAEVTLLIALLVGLYRLRRGLRYATLPLLVIATIAIEAALKLTVPQPLPPGGHTVQLIPFLQVSFAHSFPSGHVARATVLLRAAPLPWWAVATAVIVMAATRVYLSEHWLSDTVGGALLGFFVADVGRRLTTITR